MRGRLVRSLMHEERPAGECDVLWNGEDEAGMEVASGTYTLRLDLAGETVLRHVVLLK
jgi:flagellar hook assembly protein FlgD